MPIAKQDFLSQRFSATTVKLSALLPILPLASGPPFASKRDPLRIKVGFLGRKPTLMPFWYDFSPTQTQRVGHTLRSTTHANRGIRNNLPKPLGKRARTWSKADSSRNGENGPTITRTPSSLRTAQRSGRAHYSYVARNSNAHAAPLHHATQCKRNSTDKTEWNTRADAGQKGRRPAYSSRTILTSRSICSRRFSSEAKRSSLRSLRENATPS